jgi:hypothetical protein
MADIEQTAREWGDRLGAVADENTPPQPYFNLTGPELLQAMSEDRFRIAPYDNGLLLAFRWPDSETHWDTWTLAHAPEAEKFLSHSG